MLTLGHLLLYILFPVTLLLGVWFKFLAEPAAEPSDLTDPTRAAGPTATAPGSAADRDEAPL